MYQGSIVNKGGTKLPRTTDDFMDEFDQDRAKARERSTISPFIFRLKPGEKAVFRLLLNFDQQLRMDYHERYNQAEQKYDVNAACASEYGLECAYCADAKTTKDWKLKPQRYAFLPIYVHSVKKKNDAGQWTAVTYNEDGETKPVGGERMLQLKLSSSTILDDLALQFTEDSDNPSERNITRYDFTLVRNGKGLDTTYSLSAKSGAPLPLPDSVQKWTTALVLDEIGKKQPPKTVTEVDDANEDD